MNELRVLKNQPYSLAQPDKDPLFLADMREALAWHMDHCPEYHTVCESQGITAADAVPLERIPYFPVTIFKSRDLLSVPRGAIIRTLYSSSTSGQPSKIFIDQITAQRQIQAVSAILSQTLSSQRRVFIVLDTRSVIDAKGGELSSRGTAIRGMLILAKRLEFVLKDDLSLDREALTKALGRLQPGDQVCFFGFTWLIYNVVQAAASDQAMRRTLAAHHQPETVLLHIGGWKKLQQLSVTKDNFNTLCGGFFSIEPGRTVDCYGMTEQLGTIYPDCPVGYKHLPVYSEIIIRNPDTLEPSGLQTTGLIQLLSPIPHSYPGISLLSDDLGEIVGQDDCRCGIKGKYFRFVKRSESAELKGCGDSIPVVTQQQRS